MQGSLRLIYAVSLPLSRRRDLQKPDLTEVLSALLLREAQIVGGVLELE